MAVNVTKYHKISGPGIILVLLLSCSIAHSQPNLKDNGIAGIPNVTVLALRNKITVSAKDSLSLHKSALKSPYLQPRKNDLFYNTLKVHAAAHPVTKKIVDFIVVNPDTTFKNKFTGTSDANYKKYTGKKIRRIDVRRLDVFGADINNPASDNPRNFEKILNKTHFNTTENIIRKNILFSPGDRISPLILSDNERLLRRLPFISDARITVVPVSEDEADIVVLTKDVYSLGASYTYNGLKKGAVSVYDKNIFGIGHEFGVDIPYDSNAPDSPGLGFHYIADNIKKTFINTNVYYLKALGNRTYGFSISRRLITSATKYAGGISIRQMYTTSKLDTLAIPQPLKYNLQDYWIMRSFLINTESVSRIIIGARYTNNNVFNHPVILPNSFYNLQKYKLFLASAALSVQKYTKTNLLYSYGRTEDVPYGSMLQFTGGREYNEFKMRSYMGAEAAYGNKLPSLGYFYLYSGISTYLNKGSTEQGLLSLRLNYFSNLFNMGNFRIRNFIYVHYTRGVGRYTNEFLRFTNDNGFSGFKNDSVNGTQRLSVSLESVIFSPLNFYGFKFAFFGFTDFSFLSGTNEILGKGYTLSSIGLGVRLRNDNLIFNTLQIRFGYFPNFPNYSRINGVTVSAEQLLRPDNFDSGPPTVIPYQ